MGQFSLNTRCCHSSLHLLSAIMFTKILFALALVSLTSGQSFRTTTTAAPSGYCSNSLDSCENTFNRSRQERDDYRRYYGCVVASKDTDVVNFRTGESTTC